MNLQSLVLENFQGIKTASFAFSGHNAAICGDNATGKTTVFNAVTWLLFDKASTGAKGFTPKTKGANGDLHNLNHSARAVFETDDGRFLTIGKTFHEVYKKKKGSPTDEFSGHTTDYFIDGIPVKEKQYTAAIADICDAEQMKILTMPHYFSETMSWDERRKLLLEVCGDISDDEILDEMPELKELLRFPGCTDRYYTVDKFRKISVPKKTAINKELAEIPSRIDEATRSIGDVPDISDSELDTEKEKLERLQERLQASYDDILSGDEGTAEITKRISEERTRLEIIKGNHAQKEAAANSEIKLRITERKSELSASETRLDGLKRFKTYKENELKILKEKRAALMNEYNAEAAKQFDESSAVCPTCGREYSKDKVSEFRERFNIVKSEKLSELNKLGKTTASKDMINDTQTEIDRTDSDIAEAEKEISRFKSDIEAFQNQTVILPPIEESGEYKECVAIIADLERKKAEKTKLRNERYIAVKNDMDAVRMRIDELNGLRLQKQAAERTKARIAELEKKERDLASEYEQIEKALYLCDEFTKKKVSSLTDKINDKFKNVRFRLFQEQINGGIKEDCEVLIPSKDGRMVPYTFANNAARINAGLEIADALSAHWNVTVPIFIDNAESVTQLADTRMQTIRLVVSEEDKILRLETEE